MTSSAVAGSHEDSSPNDGGPVVRQVAPVGHIARDVSDRNTRHLSVLFQARNCAWSQGLEVGNGTEGKDELHGEVRVTCPGSRERLPTTMEREIADSLHSKEAAHALRLDAIVTE